MIPFTEKLLNFGEVVLTAEVEGRPNHFIPLPHKKQSTTRKKNKKTTTKKNS